MDQILTLPLDQWHLTPQPPSYVEQLEQGHLLFFPQLAFSLQESELRFLSPAFVSPKTKNISYNPHIQQLKGGCGTETDLTAITHMMARFSQHAHRLLISLFPHYHDTLQIARTSFRPVEISGRKTSYRKDDSRLHVDAFPANPNQGKRIIRVFSNINPHGENRVWRIGDTFESVAQHFLPKATRYWPIGAQLLHWLHITKTHRTAYDHLMLQMHDRMKKDMHYQKTVSQSEVHFPPASSWIVQTDQVSHAAMRGQHVLEQTFYLPVEAMKNPAQSPLRILERLVGCALV